MPTKTDGLNHGALPRDRHGVPIAAASRFVNVAEEGGEHIIPIPLGAHRVTVYAIDDSTPALLYPFTLFDADGVGVVVHDGRIGPLGCADMDVLHVDATGAEGVYALFECGAESGPLPLVAALGTLNDATNGSAHTQQSETVAISATGGVRPYTFSATGLPGGVVIDAAAGTLSAETVTGEAGAYPVTLTATDRNGSTSSVNGTLTVLAP